MSESTSGSERVSAAEFPRARGVSDWRVTGLGPQAVFAATSLAEAANLVPPMVEAAERLGILPDIDVRPEGVVVQIPDRTFHGIPVATAKFAAAVSTAAAELRLAPDPSRVQSVEVFVAQHSKASSLMTRRVNRSPWCCSIRDCDRPRKAGMSSSSARRLPR